MQQVAVKDKLVFLVWSWFVYPEPAFVGAVVGLALLLPLPPLDQAGAVVAGQADVAAAGRGADSAPGAARQEGLRAQRQLHPARQRHQKRPVGADSVRVLGVIWRCQGGEVEEGGSHAFSTGGSHVRRDKPQRHACSDTNEKKKKTCEKNISRWIRKEALRTTNLQDTDTSVTCFLFSFCLNWLLKSLRRVLSTSLYEPQQLWRNLIYSKGGGKRKKRQMDR